MEKKYRYPGTKPFSENDRDLFFGRNKDIKKLSELIVLEKLVVLFGKSGYGKSSLLNAGVIPRLVEEEKFKVLSIRLNERDRKPVELLIHHLESNKNTDSFLVDKFDITTELSGDLTAMFWYYIKSLQLAQEDCSAILLIFDQFEELFNFNDAEIKEFSQTISTLLNLNMPESVRNLMKEKMKADANYFTETEIDQLLEPLNLKVVFSLRNDRLSLLNQLKDFLPAVYKKTYELLPFDEIQALEALLEPASKEGDFTSSPFSYSDSATQLILDSLKDSENQRIETFQLQLICQYAEELVIQKQAANLKTVKIELSDADIGKPEDIFETNYKDIIGGLPETNRENVRILIEDKLIIGGTRVPLPESVITQQHNISVTLLKTLVNKRLLRSEPNTVGGMSYELSHDTLVAPIQKAAIVRRQKQQEAKRENARQTEILLLKEKRQKDRSRLLLVSCALFIALGLAAFGLYQMNHAITAENNAKEISADILELLKRQLPDGTSDVYSYFKMEADTVFANGEYENAIGFYQGAQILADNDELKDRIEKKITDSEKCMQLIQEGGKLAVTQKLDDAIVVYKKLNKINSDDPTALARIDAYSRPDILKSWDDLKLIKVTGGSFIMGCSSDQRGCQEDEKPQHRVNLSDYYIGQYEVTNKQYVNFLNQYKSDKVKKGEFIGKLMIEELEWGLKKLNNEEWQLLEGTENYPVIGVSWYGALEFCRFYGLSLPTEAQWEYAARGGQKGVNDNFLYSGSNEIDEVAWYKKNANISPLPVGQKAPNQLGIYDMSGSLFEWCNDYFSSGYYAVSEDNDPRGSLTGSDRIMRGGGWGGVAKFCTVTQRDGYGPGSRRSSIGFRVALSL